MNEVIPGPIFESRPGWGGQLKNLVAHSWGRLMLILAIIFIICWIIILTINKNRSSLSYTPTATNNTLPISSPRDMSTIEETVAPGDSYSLVVRKIVTKYSTPLSIPVTGGARLFVEYEIVKYTPRPDMTVGSIVSISRDVISQYFAKFETLTAYQKNQWERYSRSVKF